jgi:hypothetical protein
VHVAWGSLLIVLLVSFGAAVAVVVLVSIALVSLSGRRLKGRDGEAARAPVTTSNKVVAGACLVVAGLIVLYGLYVIVGA